MITIKTPEEQDKMRVAGRLAAQVLDIIGPHEQAGVSTEELDRICHRYNVEDLGCIPAPLNYRGSAGAAPFPKSICTSVNRYCAHRLHGMGSGWQKRLQISICA